MIGKYLFLDHGVESTVRKILEMYHQNTVEVDDHVWETMKLQGQQEVTPEFINRSSHTALMFNFKINFLFINQLLCVLMKNLFNNQINVRFAKYIRLSNPGLS